MPQMTALNISVTPADRPGWRVIEVTHPDGTTNTNELPIIHPALVDLLRAVTETLTVPSPEDWPLL